MSHSPVPPQDLSLEFHYDYSDGIDSEISTTNTAGNVPHLRLTAAGLYEFVFTVGVRSGFGTAYPGPGSFEWKVGYALGDTMQYLTPVPLPSGDTFTFFTQFGQGGLPGHADRLGYILSGLYTPFGEGLLNFAWVFFDVEDQTVHTFDVNGLGFAMPLCWAKRGDNVYFSHNNGVVSRWSYATGALLNSVAVSGPFLYMTRTTNFLWLAGGSGLFSQYTPALVPVANFTAPLGGRSIISHDSVFDDLHYIVTADSGLGTGGQLWTYDPSLDDLDLITNANVPPGDWDSAEATKLMMHVVDNRVLVVRTGSSSATEAYRLSPLIWVAAESQRGWCRDI